MNHSDRLIISRADDIIINYHLTVLVTGQSPFNPNLYYNVLIQNDTINKILIDYYILGET